MMQRAHRFCRSGIAAALLSFFAAAAVADDVRLISDEAIPSAQVELPHLDRASYVEREAVTREVLEQVLPLVLDALRIAPELVETQVTAGGYMLKTNASLQSKVRASVEVADELATALGWVLRQESVLVTDLGARDGPTGYVIVRFAPGSLDPTRAHSFFAHAASVAEGLGGGYTAFGDDQIFINLRGDDGLPYSGLDDAAFARGLEQAAHSFGPTPPDLAVVGRTDAHLISNDWQEATDGEAYAAKLGGADSPLVHALVPLRAQHTRLIETEASRYGWR